MSAAMQNQLFQLKFVTKQMDRLAKKAEKAEKSERKKVKTAIEKGNNEGARIFAQNVIRKKNEQMNYLRLSSRIDAVASRLESAIQVGGVTRTMSKVVGNLDKALSSMNLEKVSNIMGEFENQFGNLDVQEQYMSEAMGSTMATSAPEDDVSALIDEIGHEHGLQVSHSLGQPGNAIPDAPTATTNSPEDELMARFNQLKS
ncbi:hypothetical protein P9112_004350 [Eukaryota sp. TZLM1-RC]